MVEGKLQEFKVLSLEEDLRENEPSVSSYVEQLHKVAEDNGRYVVRLKLRSERIGYVSALIPKGVIDNNLLEKDSYINCNSTCCSLYVGGVETYYDRATNGKTQIHDGKIKTK